MIRLAFLTAAITLTLPLSPAFGQRIDVDIVSLNNLGDQGHDHSWRPSISDDRALPGGGGSDRLRIKIWEIAGGGLVYDNQLGAGDTAEPDTALTGGSIVIHDPGPKGS